MTAHSVPPSTWRNSLFLARYASIALLVLGSQWAVAQQTLGSMNGTVTESSGAVVQGATVRVRSLATNLEVKAESKSDGSFNVFRSELTQSRLPRMVSARPSIHKLLFRATALERSTPSCSQGPWHPP